MFIKHGKSAAKKLRCNDEDVFFLSEYIKRGRTLNRQKVEKPVRIGVLEQKVEKKNFNIEDTSFDMYYHITAC